jgi:Protein of unknown function (DUF938)
MDDRQYAPATQRNREAILAVLQTVLPATGTVLEISSGTGEHAVFFAPRLAPRCWLPSDPDPIARASINAWRDHAPSDTLFPAIALNVCDPVWTVEQADFLATTFLATTIGIELNSQPIQAIVNINMIHIAPWEACLGLMAGAQRILPPGGILYLYGPFKQKGEHTAPSNAAFDQSLRSRDPSWGVRDLEAVIAVATEHNLSLLETHTMPANNLSVVFQAND